jgi:hypothetical protein
MTFFFNYAYILTTVIRNHYKTRRRELLIAIFYAFRVEILLGKSEKKAGSPSAVTKVKLDKRKRFFKYIFLPQNGSLM